MPEDRAAGLNSKGGHVGAGQGVRAPPIKWGPGRGPRNVGCQRPQPKSLELVDRGLLLCPLTCQAQLSPQSRLS